MRRSDLPLRSPLRPVLTVLTVPTTLTLALSLLFAGACLGGGTATLEERAEKTPPPADAATAVFASGCFWCVESIYESVEGVYEAVSGYAGGSEPNPTYQEVSRGATSHAEVVKVYYDPEVVDFATLVDVFFGSQNPTQVNGQGPDLGRQYRSIIFYETEEEKEIAERAKAELDASGKYDRPIAAEIEPLERFWKAEEYHQDYEVRNPNDPYVRNVSIPRLERFQEKFPELLKEDGGH